MKKLIESKLRKKYGDNFIEVEFDDKNEIVTLTYEDIEYCSRCGCYEPRDHEKEYYYDELVSQNELRELKLERITK